LLISHIFANSGFFRRRAKIHLRLLNYLSPNEELSQCKEYR
jgi:hypothetical protein